MVSIYIMTSFPTRLTDIHVDLVLPKVGIASYTRKFELMGKLSTVLKLITHCCTNILDFEGLKSKRREELFLNDLGHF